MILSSGEGPRAARMATAATLWLILGVPLGGCLGPEGSESGAARAEEDPEPTGQAFRFAQFNIRELTTAKLLDEDDRQVRAAADIVARFAPDIVSINELQHDLADQPTAGLPGAAADTPLGTACEGRNARRLADRIAALHPDLTYDYTLVALGNSGFPFETAGDDSGTELAEEFRLRGFGEWPGRFNQAILSRFPILHDRVRVIVDFPWASLPGNSVEAMQEATGLSLPEGFPLFEKALVVVPIDVAGTVVHVILLHPVSSGFSDMNPFRNHDELLGAAMFIDGALPGVEPLPADARFIVVGDLNADPEDGLGIAGSTAQVFDHPKVVAHFAAGAGGTAGTHPERNSFLSGCGKDNGSIVYNPASRLQLQLDYILPSLTLGAPTASGIFWPSNTTDWDDYVLACTASDHRFVWADLTTN